MDAASVKKVPFALVLLERGLLPVFLLLVLALGLELGAEDDRAFVVLGFSGFLLNNLESKPLRFARPLFDLLAVEFAASLGVMAGDNEVDIGLTRARERRVARPKERFGGVGFALAFDDRGAAVGHLECGTTGTGIHGKVLTTWTRRRRSCQNRNIAP